ncbi:MAG: sec-independent translocase [Propionibacteriaceae bacterium]|nr:sec-independent translocase [Propionibacteriaceae bacterium]
MFGIDATEFVILIVLAVVMFGPERIPQFSRKAARLFVYLRDVANNAQSQLRTELGPEYADLNLADLNPKALVRKHLSSEIAAIDEAKAELSRTADELKSASTQVKSELSSARSGLNTDVPELPAGARFDDEAT